jgi:hypothetical protein
MSGSVMYVRDSANNKNVHLQVDGSNQLSVKDEAVATSLASILSAQSTAANQSTAHGKLDTIASNQASLATAAHQVTAHGKLDTIASSLAGTLTVSSSASAPARVNGSLASSAVKASGDLSSSINGSNYRKASIFGSSSSMSAKVRVHLSHDNTNYYEDHTNQFFANSSNGHIAGHFDLNAPWFKIEFVDSATYTLEYALVD